jgi:hypothetical protein
MDIESGKLYDLTNLSNRKVMESLLEKKQVRLVPEELAADAQRVLDGNPEAQVDLAGDSELAKWARKERLADHAKSIVAGISRMKSREIQERYARSALQSIVAEELGYAAKAEQNAKTT